MARPSAIWWWDAKQRWAFQFGGRRYLAPEVFKEDHREHAERWHVQRLARLDPEAAVDALRSLVARRTGEATRERPGCTTVWVAPATSDRLDRLALLVQREAGGRGARRDAATAAILGEVRRREAGDRPEPKPNGRRDHAIPEARKTAFWLGPDVRAALEALAREDQAEWQEPRPNLSRSFARAVRRELESREPTAS